MVKNKSKRKKTNKPTSKKYKFFKISGDSVVRGRCCPRCGPGIFLMITPNRSYCGTCHYTEFVGKAKPEIIVEKKVETKKAKR
jgi:small subunit ribosomal protein S27Ae